MYMYMYGYIHIHILYKHMNIDTSKPSNSKLSGSALRTPPGKKKNGQQLHEQLHEQLHDMRASAMSTTCRQTF